MYNIKPDMIDEYGRRLESHRLESIERKRESDLELKIILNDRHDPIDSYSSALALLRIL